MGTKEKLEEQIRRYVCVSACTCTCVFKKKVDFMHVAVGSGAGLDGSASSDELLPSPPQATGGHGTSKSKVEVHV